MKFVVPIKMKQSKNKYFILNQNNYRNAHHRVLSSTKRGFTDVVKGLDLQNHLIHPYDSPIRVHYTYYPASNRIYDKMNVCAIIDKYLMDALQKVGVITDDNYKLVDMPTMSHGGVDRENPRMEVEIIQLKEYPVR